MTDKAIESIELTNREFERLAGKQDASGMGELYVDDARFLPPDMPALEGRPAIVEGLNGLFAAGYYRLELETVNIEVRGDLAVRQGRYQAWARMPQGEFVEQGKTIEVYREQPDGSWLFEVDMFNRDAPLPA